MSAKTTQRHSLILGVGIALLTWIPGIDASSMAMSRGRWREFVDGGSSIARHERVVLDQGSAIGSGVVALRMRMLLLMVVRMRWTLTGD
jgi:hypothetical protein